MDDKNIERGFAILQQMTGGRAEEVEARWKALHPDLARLIVGFVAGEMWTRPHLDLRTRSLITVAAMTALGRPNALELNIRMALNNGATREEIGEVILHMAAYAGFPAAWEGMIIANKVFQEHPS
ncbi:MAG: carboxymuconolactone decarboxylase family protein [Abditibacteriales bacterium]|nr:carboxymuconolactone decarboxylase family protein [Abditibacteriales bacterium]MDW8366982.1 carboxymuconolactone decarboxylase family protein [Abditibacteriales bacterium]